MTKPIEVPDDLAALITSGEITAEKWEAMTKPCMWKADLGAGCFTNCEGVIHNRVTYRFCPDCGHRVEVANV